MIALEKLYRVTALFSATMPVAIERLARKYLRSYCHISIGEPGIGLEKIHQTVEIMTEGQKKHRLQEILADSVPPIIIFANQKTEVELIAKMIERWDKHKACVYHGSKTQE